MWLYGWSSSAIRLLKKIKQRNISGHSAPRDYLECPDWKKSCKFLQNFQEFFYLICTDLWDFCAPSGALPIQTLSKFKQL